MLRIRFPIVQNKSFVYVLVGFSIVMGFFIVMMCCHLKLPVGHDV